MGKQLTPFQPLRGLSFEDTMTNDQLRERINSRLHQLGLSVGHAAELAGLPPAGILAWLRGDRANVQYTTAAKFVSAIGLDLTVSERPGFTAPAPRKKGAPKKLQKKANK